MSSDAQLSREEVVRTREALHRKIVALEEQLRDDVQRTKDAVSEVMDDVTATAHRLSPSYHVRQHPLATVGVATAIGFLVTRRLQVGQQASEVPPADPKPSAPRLGLPRGSALWAWFSSTFPEEISMVKAMVVEEAVKALAGKVKAASPRYAPQIAEIENSVVDRAARSRRHEPSPTYR